MDINQQLAESFSSEGDTPSRTNLPDPSNAEGTAQNQPNPSQGAEGSIAGGSVVTPMAGYGQPGGIGPFMVNGVPFFQMDAAMQSRASFPSQRDVERREERAVLCGG
jgi:hypothetical protein